ncbi:MAG: 4-alpha-glucanotransferase [Lachnospiraceae bacterium]|nr:4-alpha-glucanotransferase [Lachnospiraceae bacterium]
MKRSSGILMPVFSLPSPYGIGTIGKAAYDFVDFLHDAGQTWWQILPVGPTSYGDSPYQSPSAYAGNPYFIDLDLLVQDGLLTKKEINALSFGDDPGHIDYGLLYENRLPLLKKAMERGWDGAAEEIERFRSANAFWLEDYAMFMAIKRANGMKPWLEWEDEGLHMHRQDALDRIRPELEEDIRLFIFTQYLFFKQWAKLREYAHEKGVMIMGDMALYVALDSADVWSSPENFLLDEKNVPVDVAGVPPDYFTADGQLWGNPLYNYGRMEQDGYGWWIRRIGGAAQLYDAIRIDHFRGLANFWAVPFGEATARNGRWVQGPGMRLISALKGWFTDVQFIAEDLGFPTPEVAQLLYESGFPGMKVLEFAFDSKEESSYLPHTYPRNCICYTGTHDNDTVLGWKKTASRDDLKKAKAYLGINDEEGFVRGMIRGGMESVADLFIAQMQDYLELGAEARINTPGAPSGNWCWRMLPGMTTRKLAKEIYAMTDIFGRL